MYKNSGENLSSNNNNNESSPWDALMANPNDSELNYSKNVDAAFSDFLQGKKAEAEAAKSKQAEIEERRRKLEEERAKLEAEARALEQQNNEIKTLANQNTDIELTPEAKAQLMDDFEAIDSWQKKGRKPSTAENFLGEVFTAEDAVAYRQEALARAYAASNQEPANIDDINRGLGGEGQPTQPEQEPGGSTDTLDQAMMTAYPDMDKIWDDATVQQARDEWIDSQPGLKNLSEKDRATAEEITDQEIKEIKDRAKKKRNFKQFLRRTVIISLIASSLAGVFGGLHSLNKAPADNKNAVERVDEDKTVHDSYDDYAGTKAEAKESIKGIYDGYGEKGMYLSENKLGPLNFAAGKEVAEVCKNDEVEMLKYTARNQVESFADYLANLPEQLQPEGFKGLSIIETEKKLESLSDDQYESMQKSFADTMDNAFTRRTKLNGKYQNAYMRMKDAAKGATHGNMEVVECTSNESNLEVCQYFWVDENGNEIGSMTVKIIYDENGDISGGCLQVVNQEGSKPHIYGGMPKVIEENAKIGKKTSTVTKPERGDEDDDDDDDDGGGKKKTTKKTITKSADEDTGESAAEDTKSADEDTKSAVEGTDLESKNKKAQIDNAGKRATQLDLDENVTPKTDIEQDRENFEAIRQQQAEDEAAKKQAEQAKAEQEAKEQQAAKEAEARRKAEQEAAAKADAAEAAARAERERQANEEAAKAQAKAVEQQRQVAEAERQAAAERAQREQAQRQAEAATQAREAEAAQNTSANAEDRAEMFENGDY